MKLKLGVLALTAIFTLTGCVTGTKRVELSTPDYTTQKSSSGAIHIAAIADARQFEEKPNDPSTPSVQGSLAETSAETRVTLIGRMRNAYGKAMGGLSTSEGSDITDEVRKLLVTGLEGRGYTITDDATAASASISVRVDKFWSWFTPGAFTFSIEAEVACNISHTAAGKQQEFNISGAGQNTAGGRIGANVALTYERAYSDFLNNLDNALNQAGL